MPKEKIFDEKNTGDFTVWNLSVVSVGVKLP